MTEEDQSDKILIDRYLAGDKSTLAILVKRWHKIFFEKAFWVLRDKDLSKDVAQECWLIIISKLPTLKNANSFKSWALRIIYTKSIDAHKLRVKEELELNSINNQPETESKEEEREEMEGKLLKAIQDLSKDKQDIIRLFYLENYSMKELSSFLQIPVGTVKSRLFKAREKLKSIIKL